MDRLTPVIFDDAWGSNVALASLQGRPVPSPTPESELWMGAHESGPAGTDRPGSPDLATVIATNPTAELGPECVARFGERLPFLLKVLAPGRAISIQAHPSAEQATALRETTGDAVYVDDAAKPELLLAIAPFEVFVGLRRYDQMCELRDRLAIDRFDEIVQGAGGHSDPAHAVLAGVLGVPAAEVADFVGKVISACIRLEGTADWVGEVAAAVVDVAETHPDDIGLAVLLLMHHLVLQPGEYVDVAPGVLHSYVRGLGVEVLANSDNVVRAGLTSKEVNVTELLRIVDPRADGVPGRARLMAPGVEVFESSSDRFLLHRVAPGRMLPSSAGPRIAFCLRGQVDLVSSDQKLALGDTRSAFLPGGSGEVFLDGEGEVYVVTVPGL